MATEFHLFPRLPYELRAMVWSFAAHPRHIYPHMETTRGTGKLRGFVTLPAPPAPAVMHACSEARRFAPYRKAFVAPKEGKFKPAAGYVWVNFELDMFCLSSHKYLDFLKPHEAEIRRLRVTWPDKDAWDWDWVHEAVTYLSGDSFEDFPALRELQMAMPDRFLGWAQVYWNGFTFGGCPRRDVRFIDLQSGLILSGDEAYMAEVWYEKHGGMVQDISNIDEEVRYSLEDGGFLESLRFNRTFWEPDEKPHGKSDEEEEEEEEIDEEKEQSL